MRNPPQEPNESFWPLLTPETDFQNKKERFLRDKTFEADSRPHLCRLIYETLYSSQGHSVFRKRYRVRNLLTAPDSLLKLDFQLENARAESQRRSINSVNGNDSLKQRRS